MARLFTRFNAQGTEWGRGGRSGAAGVIAPVNATRQWDLCACSDEGQFRQSCFAETFAGRVSHIRKLFTPATTV